MQGMISETRREPAFLCASRFGGRVEAYHGAVCPDRNQAAGVALSSMSATPAFEGKSSRARGSRRTSRLKAADCHTPLGGMACQRPCSSGLHPAARRVRRPVCHSACRVSVTRWTGRCSRRHSGDDNRQGRGLGSLPSTVYESAFQMQRRKKSSSCRPSLELVNARCQLCLSSSELSVSISVSSLGSVSTESSSIKDLTEGVADDDLSS